MYKTPSVRVESVWYSTSHNALERVLLGSGEYLEQTILYLPNLLDRCLGLGLRFSRTVYIQINLNHAGQPNQHWCINSSKTISRMPPALKLKAVDNTTEMLFYL